MTKTFQMKGYCSEMKILTIIVSCLAAVAVQAAPIQFVSHAGDQFSAPGHSIPAYEVAIRQQADFLKLDLHLTRDNVIVMMHDPNTRKKMDKDLEISTHTYQELVDGCTYKPVGGFDKEKIVRMEQALEMVKDKPISLWLDLKGFSSTPPDRSAMLAEKAMALIKQYGISKERLIVATWSHSALEYMKMHHPEVRRVLHVIMSRKNENMCQLNTEEDPAKCLVKPENILSCLLKKAKELDLYGYNIPIRSPFFSRKLVQELKAKGCWVCVWLVQNKNYTVKAVKSGADAVVTDNLKIVQPAARMNFFPNDSVKGGMKR